MRETWAKQRPALGLLALGMAIFGSGTPISAIVTDAFPVFLASAARMLLAAAVLVPLMLIAARNSGEPALPEISRANWLRLCGIALAGMFLFSVFMLYGMKEASGAVGGVVMATTPAVTAAGSIIFLRDRLDRWKAIAIGMAVGGVLAVNLGGAEGRTGTGDVLLGSALVFGAVCGEAAYTLIGKKLTADLSPLSIAAIASAMAALLFVPPAVLQLDELSPGAVATTDWLALAWWGLGTLALGSILWFRGVSQVAGTTASAFMGVMPVSALLLSYVLLGESFEPIHAVGMLAVLGGIAAVTRAQAAE